MLSLFVTLLTIVLFLNCLFLILLILMQLPKKEAGLGQAFGSAATDTLFGAGSGNVLTKATKYAAGLFFALAIILSILGPRTDESRVRMKRMRQATSSPVAAQPAAPAPAAPQLPSGLTLLGTNTAPAQPAPASNAAPAKP
ncbi:MAG: preprotein translocase subunit SecG [Verrucomicrobiae bacterium]|nr:preprotein translocase subunit SecG [Verrucomicrobiae bacterium]